jgi:hypothetical protein
VGLHLQPDWQRALGQYVEVRRHGEVIRTGTVVAVMPDSSLLWISADGVFPRQMVEKVEGYQIYSRYPWDAAPPSNRSH